MAERSVRVLSWNLFHGRDHAPDRSLHTWRSRLTRKAERNETHAQVNHALRHEFFSILAGAEWDVALLQECPPRWAEDLATVCRAEAHLVLTARNLPAALAPLQRLAARVNPDLTASWEGGSNLTLVRGKLGSPIIRDRRSVTLTRDPETRRMAFTVTRSGLCVANLHASVARSLAEDDVLEAAEAAVQWAGNAPLVFGGDLNLRPSSSGIVFDGLADEFGLIGPTSRDAIDHLLSRNLEIESPPEQWAPELREVADRDSPSHRVRLSDHAPVDATFKFTA